MYCETETRQNFGGICVIITTAKFVAFVWLRRKCVHVSHMQLFRQSVKKKLICKRAICSNARINIQTEFDVVWNEYIVCPVDLLASCWTPKLNSFATVSIQRLWRNNWAFDSYTLWWLENKFYYQKCNEFLRFHSLILRHLTRHEQIKGKIPRIAANANPKQACQRVWRERLDRLQSN